MTDIVFCEDPHNELANILKDEYKNGVVGLIGYPHQELIRVLVNNGNTIETGDKFCEHVRCVIGIGGYEDIIKARRLSQTKRLFLVPTVCDNICFSPYIAKRDTENLYSEPEKVFYCNKTYKQLRGSVYSALLGLLAICIDTIAIKPSSKAITNLATQIKGLLEDPLDVRVCAEFIAKFCSNQVFGRNAIINELAFYKASSAKSADLAFFTNYLIVASFIQFTKMDFNGIFIGKDKVYLSNATTPKTVCNNASAYSLASREAVREIIPDIGALSRYANRYLWESGKKHIEAPCADKIFKDVLDAEERVLDMGLLASLCRIGFIDKLINGDNK